MTEFKAGDVVTRIGGLDTDFMKKGNHYRVVRQVGTTLYVERDGWAAGESFSASYFVPTNTNTMSKTLIERAAIAMKGEPEKTFIRVGAMNLDGSLTTEGKHLFDKWLFESSKNDFKKEVIDPIVAADKAEAKAAKDAS